jgi:hypothetical protein
VHDLCHRKPKIYVVYFYMLVKCDGLYKLVIFCTSNEDLNTFSRILIFCCFFLRFHVKSVVNRLKYKIVSVDIPLLTPIFVANGYRNGFNHMDTDQGRPWCYGSVCMETTFGRIIVMSWKVISPSYFPSCIRDWAKTIDCVMMASSSVLVFNWLVMLMH